MSALEKDDDFKKKLEAANTSDIVVSSPLITYQQHNAVLIHGIKYAGNLLLNVAKENK